MILVVCDDEAEAFVLVRLLVGREADVGNVLLRVCAVEELCLVYDVRDCDGVHFLRCWEKDFDVARI